MVGYGSVQIVHDETVVTGIRNGVEMVVAGGVSLHLGFLHFHGVRGPVAPGKPGSSYPGNCEILLEDMFSRVILYGTSKPVTRVVSWWHRSRTELRVDHLTCLLHLNKPQTRHLTS